MEKATITSSVTVNTFIVSGVLNFDTVTPLVQHACELIEQANQEITFDFSETTQSNSAGLAFMTALLREATAKKKSIQFLHLPATLAAAAKISDLDQFLPCKP